MLPAGQVCTCEHSPLMRKPLLRRSAQGMEGRGSGLRLTRHVAPLQSALRRPQQQQRGARGASSWLCMASCIQFIRGVDEPSVPDVRLTRSRDGSSGTAAFTFKEPSVFSEAASDLGDITGMYMNDDEGTISTVDVQAKFVNGKPDRIEAKYVMRSSFEWDRFMRFMDRYAEAKELGFTKSGKQKA